MHRFNLDWGLVVVNLALAGLSLSLIWSNDPSLIVSQFIYFIVGFILFFIFSQINSDILKSFAKPFYLISVILLVITLLNIEIRGASRWIDIFGARMQPSELVKPFLIISFAYFMSGPTTRNIPALIKSIVQYAFPLVVIFLQPDLGNVIIYFLLLMAMLLANNFNFKLLLTGIFTVIIGSPILWGFLKEYQKQRVISFINPQNDPLGAGYNAIQSMIAVGSGGLFGLGLGRGTQSHLRFLPENHTDFIFASLSEELGLFGGFILLALYLYILWKILKLASNSTSQFNYLVCIGVFSQILAQVFINISMNMGIIPITGITLPLISSGGSSLIATLIALGIVASLEKEQKHVPLVIR